MSDSNEVDLKQSKIIQDININKEKRKWFGKAKNEIQFKIIELKIMIKIRFQNIKIKPFQKEIKIK